MDSGGSFLAELHEFDGGEPHYLSSFGDQVVDYARANGVTMDLFLLMDNDDIKIMSPMHGNQLKLRAYRDRLRNENGVSQLDNSTSSIYSLGTDSSLIAASSSIQSASVPHDIASSPSTKPTSPIPTVSESSYESSRRAASFTSVTSSSSGTSSIKMPPMDFLTGLVLEPKKALYPEVPIALIEKWSTAKEEMPSKVRNKVIRTFATLISSEYHKVYGTWIVPSIVKEHVAKAIITYFPCLQDKTATGYGLIFTSDPVQSGYLYTSLRNRRQEMQKCEPRKKKSKTNVEPATGVSEEEYEAMVLQLTTQLSETKMNDLMQKTYEHRRHWIISSRQKPTKERIGPGDFLTKYPIFILHPEQFLDELKRICPSVELETSLEKLIDGKGFLDLVTSVSTKRATGPKNKSEFYSEGDPATETASIVRVHEHDGEIFISIPSDNISYFRCHSLSKALKYLVGVHYTLDLNYPSPIKSFLTLVAIIMKVPDTPPLSTTAKAILVKILSE